MTHIVVHLFRPEGSPGIRGQVDGEGRVYGVGAYEVRSGNKVTIRESSSERLETIVAELLEDYPPDTTIEFCWVKRCGALSPSSFARPTLLGSFRRLYEFEKLPAPERKALLLSNPEAGRFP